VARIAGVDLPVINGLKSVRFYILNRSNLPKAVPENRLILTSGVRDPQWMQMMLQHSEKG
jgi:hypothetical protein